MEEDISKKPLVDILKEMTKIDNEIDLLMLKHEKLRLEVVRRFPPLKDKEEFKKKEKSL